MAKVSKLTTQQKEDLKLVRRMNKTQRLLKNFGAQAFAYDPGVRCYIPGHGNWFVDFDEATWRFIEPLLKELVKYRKESTKHGKM